MDAISNKALIIGVGLFITIAITSGILMIVSSMKDVYQQVYETDTSINGMFDEFSAFEDERADNSGEKWTTIDLLNTANKYKDRKATAATNQNRIGVIVKENNTEMNNEAGINNLKSRLGILDESITNINLGNVRKYNWVSLQRDGDEYHNIIITFYTTPKPV